MQPNDADEAVMAIPLRSVGLPTARFYLALTLTVRWHRSETFQCAPVVSAATCSLCDSSPPNASSPSYLNP